MIKTIKVMIKPNKNQQSKLFKMANASRFAYNWAIAKERENYANENKFLSDVDLRREFTQFKKEPDNQWLNTISNDVMKQAIKDACNSYKRFFDGVSNYPHFKSKRKSKPSFYQDTDKIKFTSTHVKLEKIAINKKKNRAKINWIRLAEKNRVPVGEGIKYYNPRIRYDGLNWFLTIGIESEVNYYHTQNDGIGIDLGVKELAVTSDNEIYPNINKTKEVHRLEKKKRRLQRQVSRKYERNKEGNQYKKTSNIIKMEKEILKVIHRLTNIRNNYIHYITSNIVNRKPKFLVIEDLNVMGMMKNKHLSKAIQKQKFYEFRRILEYKCKWNNIPLIIANRYFPSSKLCSSCGSIKSDLRLSDRTYQCTNCGNSIDRDYQASINLREYGEREFADAN